MKTLIAVLLASALAGSAWGADTYVDDCGGTGSGTIADPYCSIQTALDNANPNDTIHVALGTYNETVAIATGFNGGTIIGKLGSMPLVTGGMTLAAGLTGVTVENLHITGEGASSSIIRMLGGVNDLTLDNLIIDGELTSGRHGFAGGQLEGDATITNCEFRDILGWALFESRSGSGGGGSPLGTIIFSDNDIHNCNGTVVFRGDESSEPTDDSSYTDTVTISGNTWQTIGGNASETGSQWAAFEVNRAKVANVFDNSVNDVNVGLAGQGQAAQFWAITALDVHDNSFTNNDQGIQVSDVPDTLPTGGSINNSCITGNGWGLAVDTGATVGDLDAEDNWWGAADGPSGAGPGSGDSITTNVDADPWLTEEATACAAPAVPAISTWGIGILALLLLTTGGARFLGTVPR